MNYVEKKNTITNNTEFYLLVGNCVDVISHHKTLEEASKALDKFNVADSKYGSVWVLEPNETRSGTYTQTIYEEQDGDLFDLSKLGL